MVGVRCLISLVLLVECGVFGMPHLNTPELRFNDNSLYCVLPSRSPHATRWLMEGLIYNRTVMNFLPTATLQLRNGETVTVQCALETDEGISEWSTPMRYVSRYPLLAAKDEQIIAVSEDDKFVHFSSNIQLPDEAMQNVERFEFIQDDSCEPSLSYQFYQLWSPPSWSANGSVHVDKKVDIFVTDMFRVKLNLTAFPVTNNTLYIKCAVRFASDSERFETCHKIQIETNSPACSTGQEKSSSSFTLNFIEDICENYKEGGVIRYLLKRDNCLRRSGFNLQITCANQTSAHLQIHSTAPVTAAMLGGLLSEVASVTTGVPDVSSTESSTLSSDEPMVPPSRKPCSITLPCNIALESGIGLLLLVLVLFLMLLISYILNCVMCKKMYHKERLPQSSASSHTMGRQESRNDGNESVIVNNSGQSMNLTRAHSTAQTLSHFIDPANITGCSSDPVTVIPNSSVSQSIDIPVPPTTTTGPVVTQPYQASSESETGPSARVTTTPGILRSRRSPHSSTTRSPDSGNHAQVIDQQPTAMMQPFTQHNGATPNVSASMPGEVFNIPGAAVISTSSVGDEMEYDEQEESAQRHQQAVPALNTVPEAPENHIQPGHPVQMENRSAGVWLRPFTPANCITTQDCLLFVVPRHPQQLQSHAGATASGNTGQFV